MLTGESERYMKELGHILMQLYLYHNISDTAEAILTRRYSLDALDLVTALRLGRREDVMLAIQKLGHMTPQESERFTDEMVVAFQLT